MYEKDIGMKKPKEYANIKRFYQLINKSFDTMQTKAENKLNLLKFPLSDEAKKRLKWMYIICFECDNKISKAAKRIGVSRQWLSTIHSAWLRSDKDPRSLESKSRAPKNTDKRKRIDQKTEDKIIEVRKEYHWGKDKLITVLDRDHDITVGASTINRYLDKHGLLDVKISKRIKLAHKNKIEQKQKCRPPEKIKDYKPGALVEKWKGYLKRQSKRQANSRKMKNREKIDKLMDQIDKRLDGNYK